jgi:hypothetical protein
MRTPHPFIPGTRSASSFASIAASLTLACVAVVHATPPEGSPYSLPQPAFFGQVRPRTELDHKALYDTSANKALLSTHVRSRIGFTASPSLNVEIKVELQDTRVFGTEPTGTTTPPPATPHTASTGNMKGVDLLQGYIAVQEGPVKVALGRQKMQLGAGRYLSTLEWAPYSRAFDGLSANWSMESGDLTAFTFLVADSTNSTAGAAPTKAATSDRLLLSGLHYNRKISETLTAEVSLFHDQSRLRTVYSGDSSTSYDLIYGGERVVGRFGMFAFEEELLYQSGKVRYGTSKNSEAWQIALRAGIVLPKVKANLGVDAMSGDDDQTDDTYATYRANYYFAHAYFGWMDYFVSNPRYGVVDYRADVDALMWQGETRTASLKAQYHYFTPQNAPSALDDAYGQEIDAEIHLGLYPKSNIVLGAGVFLPGESASRLPVAKVGATQKDGPGYFLYFMPTFNF